MIYKVCKGGLNLTNTRRNTTKRRNSSRGSSSQARSRSWSQQVRFTPEWAAWRLSVFKRDGFKCVICQKSKAGLEPHHIIRKIERPDLIHDIDNGVTLCTAHHEYVTGQEGMFVVRFKGYVTRLKNREQAMSDTTGLGL